MAGPILEIQTPVRTPRLGGISKVATVRVNERIGNTEEIVFVSDGCAFPNQEALRCFDDEPADKTYSGIAIDDAIGAPFTLYAGVSCFIAPDPDELERAERILAAGQDRALEDVLESWATGGTALTAGGTVAGAIAEVEQALDNGYIGQGVILMSRADAVRAGMSLIHGLDGIPTTINGTPVLASGHVTSGTVYGVGAIVVEHSPVTSYEAMDHEKNMHHALAEAVFVLAVDCEFRVKSSTGA